MHRAYSPNPIFLDSNQVFCLPKDMIHRFFHVLRLKEGDRVEIFDGTQTFQGILSNPTLGLLIHCESILTLALPYQITLVQALVPTAKLEWIAQKATELGVHQIILLETSHSLLKASDVLNKPQKLSRLKSIMAQASRQCQRPDVPELLGPLPFQDFTSQIHPQALFLVGDLNAQQLLSSTLLKHKEKKDFYILIGPEGDFSKQEYAALKTYPVEFVKFSPYVLRTETAGLCAISIVHAYSGQA